MTPHAERDLKPLADTHPPQRRLRVGDYRALLGVPGADAPDNLPVLAVRHRREAY